MRNLRALAFVSTSLMCGSAAVFACGDAEDSASPTTDASASATPDAGATDAPTDAASDAASSGDASADAGIHEGGGAAAARLSLSGTQILDPSGAVIRLRGWNWGEWGTVQPEDGADNRAQGANVVRIPLRWWGQYGADELTTPIAQKVDSRIDGSPFVDPGHLATLDAVIANAAAAGMWIDLFVDSNCGQENNASVAAYCGTGTDGGVASFSNDPQRLAEFVTVWKSLVTRYRSQPFIGMYEILPEPSFGCTDEKNCADYGAAPAFYTPIAQAIRALDPLTPILVGPNGGYSLANAATAYIDPALVSGLIYTADVWLGDALDPGNLSALTDFRQQKTVPLFVQQVGIKQADPDAGALTTQILSDLDEDAIGWTWWTYRASHTDTPVGFAPWYQAADGGWQESASWLPLITAHFAE